MSARPCRPLRPGVDREKWSQTEVCPTSGLDTAPARTGIAGFQPASRAGGSMPPARDLRRGSRAVAHAAPRGGRLPMWPLIGSDAADAASSRAGAEPAGKPALPVSRADAEPAGKPALPVSRADAEPAGKPALPVSRADAEPAGKPALPVSRAGAEPAGKPAIPVSRVGAEPAGKPALPVSRVGAEPAARPSALLPASAVWS